MANAVKTKKRKQYFIRRELILDSKRWGKPKGICDFNRERINAHHCPCSLRFLTPAPLTRSLPLARPSRACGFAHIPFAASQAAQVSFSEERDKAIAAFAILGTTPRMFPVATAQRNVAWKLTQESAFFSEGLKDSSGFWSVFGVRKVSGHLLRWSQNSSMSWVKWTRSSKS